MRDMIMNEHQQNMSVFNGTLSPSGTPIPEDDEKNFYNYHHRIILSCFICSIVVVGVAGNTLVMAAVVLSRKLQTKTNAFVINLCIADLLCCAALPFNVYTKLYKGDEQPLAKWLCMAVSFNTFICVGACFVSLMLIGINRYFKIVRPTMYNRVFRSWVIALMIVGSWLYPIILICVSINFGTGRYGYSERYRVCTRNEDVTNPNPSNLVNILGDALLVLPTFLITLGAYALIHAHLKKHTARRLAAILRRLTASLRRREQVVITSAKHSPVNTKTSPHDPEPALLHLPRTLDGQTASESNHQQQDKRDVDNQEGGTSNDSEAAHRDPPPSRQPNFARLQTEQSCARIRKDQMEITKSLFIIVCVHIVLVTPFAVVIVTPDSERIVPWVFTLFVATPAINPFVYGWKHPHFRAVFKAILSCRASKIPEPSKTARRLVARSR